MDCGIESPEDPNIERQVATRIFRVRRMAGGYYEVRDDFGNLLGTTGDEAKAVHHAQCSAQFFREQGLAARVLVKRDEGFVEPELLTA